MKDLNDLIARLSTVAGMEDKKGAFKTVIHEIELFYTENLFLNKYEVGILLTDNEKTVLSFACPEYLIDSGMIPISSVEAYSSRVFRTGQGFIENNIQQQKHLAIFEIIRTPEDKIKPVYKMMGALIATGEEKLGVIEISRRASDPTEIGEDFSETDLLFLQNSISRLAPSIKKVLPQNFRGKIS